MSKNGGKLRAGWIVAGLLTDVVGRETIAEMKGRELGVDRLSELFGLAALAAR